MRITQGKEREPAPRNRREIRAFGERAGRALQRVAGPVAVIAVCGAAAVGCYDVEINYIDPPPTQRECLGEQDAEECVPFSREGMSIGDSVRVGNVRFESVRAENSEDGQKVVVQAMVYNEDEQSCDLASDEYAVGNGERIRMTLDDGRSFMIETSLQDGDNGLLFSLTVTPECD